MTRFDSSFHINLFLKYSNFTKEDLSHLNFNLKTLLKLEKQRRNIDQEKVLFVSAGQLARIQINPNKTLERIKELEEEKFGAYLWDIIEYSLKLDLIKEIPKDELELLNLANKIKLKDITKFQVLKQKQVNKEEIKELLSKTNNPMEKGEYYEQLYAKKLPTQHFYKEIGNIILTCEPDGIEENQVYEFKSHKNIYLANKYLKSAKIQAICYGICFEKENYLLEQYIVNKNGIREFKGKVNQELIKELIRKYL